MRNSPKPRQLARHPNRRPRPSQKMIQRAFLQALRHHQSGRLEEAAADYKRVIALKPQYAEAHNNLGIVLVAQRRIAEAIARYRQALLLSPDNPSIHNNLGLALAADGSIDEAAAQYERALMLNPASAETHYNLGLALAAKGAFDDAVEHYERALAIQPGNAAVHFNLGIALAAKGRITDAAGHYQVTLSLDPDHAEAHNNLGFILNEQGRREAAVEHLKRALILRPIDITIRNNLALALTAQGSYGEAILQLREGLLLHPEHAVTHSNLGFTLAAQGRIDEAVASYQRALAFDPDRAEAHNNLGNIFKSQGRFENALEHFGCAIAINPDYAEAHFNRAEVKTFRQGESEIASIEGLAGRRDLSARQKMYINFAAAKALEDSGDHARAFEYMREGNALKRQQSGYDESNVLRLFERVSAVFGKGLLERLEGQGDSSSVPVFVVGMPRSGSTLIEQILASHPLIHGAGELADLDRIAHGLRDEDGRPVPYPERVPDLDGEGLRKLARSYLAGLPAADGKVRITDKAPGNFLNIGFIRLILPNARIIHTVRSPVDTCISCYSKLFASGNDYSFDLAELGRYFRGYSELMRHWRTVLPQDAMLDVRYEEVVDDFEGQARRLINYCGLPWDDRCISFHETSRPVNTASAVQVRAPIFRSSLQRWRRYEAALLEPLMNALKGAS